MLDEEKKIDEANEFVKLEEEDVEGVSGGNGWYPPLPKENSDGEQNGTGLGAVWIGGAGDPDGDGAGIGGAPKGVCPQSQD